MPETAGHRCSWCGDAPLYVGYHDRIRGRPERNSRALFEKLCLDGQQAGLAWITILRKQETYRTAYAGFEPERIARFDDGDIARRRNAPSGFEGSDGYAGAIAKPRVRRGSSAAL